MVMMRMVYIDIRSSEPKLRSRIKEFSGKFILNLILEISWVLVN